MADRVSKTPIPRPLSTSFFFSVKRNRVESGFSDVACAQVITPLRCGAAGLISREGHFCPPPLPSFSPLTGIVSHTQPTKPPLAAWGPSGVPMGTFRHPSHARLTLLFAGSFAEWRCVLCKGERPPPLSFS